MRSLESAELRVWAGVWRAETAAGGHYAKQNCQLVRGVAAAVLAEMTDAELAEWGGSLPGWLEELLVDPPLGRATGGAGRT